MKRWRGRRNGPLLCMSAEEHRRPGGRGPMLALAGVLLFLGTVGTAREMADTEPGGSVVSNLGYAVAEALLEVYIVAGEALVMGGLIYLLFYLRSRKGAKEDPAQPYPTPRPHGRGSDRPLLPRGRRLRAAQPPPSTLRIPQAPCGLGGHRPGTLPATEGRGERTLVLARRREVLLSPVPWGGGAAPFLVAPAGEEAQALPGVSAPRRPLRDGRGPGDAARRLDFAFGFAPQAGFSRLGFPRRRVGKVGKLQCLRCKAASALRRQPSSYLL